ncbi:MAG: Gfo/Idh/MocA family oxidoreductase [Candidatus Poribacteria bacterium]|nr:Gfo/Idh/MocA family oxidoreductase [Candidatus Poribacteria bacterium]
MTLKWGVLGAGSVAQRRAIPAINKAKGATLHAVLSRDAERASRIATEHEAKKYYTTVEDLLSDPELDAVYISTPVYLHCEQVIQASERGFHVLCDKPMGMNPEECQRMIDACEANGVHLQICFLFRFHSCFQQIRNWVKAGHFGQIVQGRMPILKPFQIDKGAWRGNPELGGGGCLMDLGAHSVDLLRYIIGEVSEVSAFCNSTIHHYDVEETGTILMRFENGAQAVTDTSFSAAGCDLVLEIYGTDGWVLVYNDEGWKIKTFLDGQANLIPSQYEDLYQFQFEHFARCVAEDEQPIATGFDGLRTNQILAAAYESDRTGKAIRCSR